MTDPHN